MLNKYPMDVSAWQIRGIVMLRFIPILLITGQLRAADSLVPVLQIDAGNVTAHVSPLLYGIMTEEINYSYDGGLYAELIRNRTFQDNASNPENQPQNSNNLGIRPGAGWRRQ
jgi:hypothetical protein